MKEEVTIQSGPRTDCADRT